MTATTTNNTTPVEPEWVRPGVAADRFGLSRPYLYHLMSEGVVRYRSLKRPGASRGPRIVNVASLRDFIELDAEGGEK